MKFSRVINVQHPTKTQCIWGGRLGKKCNKKSILLFFGRLRRNISHVFSGFRVKKLVRYRSLAFYTDFFVIGQNKQIYTVFPRQMSFSLFEFT